MQYSDLEASFPAASELPELEFAEAAAEAITAVSAPAANDTLALHAHDLAVWRTRTPARLKIADIEIDLTIHARGGTYDTHIVDELRASIEAGLPIPPIVVFRADGSNRYFLADGFCRIEAAKVAGNDEIDAEIVQAGRDSATRCAVFTNARHGNRLGLGDLQRAYNSYVDHNRFDPQDVPIVAQVLGCSIRYAYLLTQETRNRSGREQDAEITRRRTAGETYRSIAHDLGLPPATVKDRHVRFVQSAKTEYQTGSPHDVVLEAPEVEVVPPVKGETGQPETSSTLTTTATSPYAEVEPWALILAAARSVHRHLPSGEWLNNNPCPGNLRAKLARDLPAAETRFKEIRAAFDASADPGKGVPPT